MSFLESRISPRITADTIFAVTHPSRTKITFEGGQTLQHFGSATPKHRVNLALGVRSASDFQELVDAFYVCMFGGYEGLRVKNWQDYQASLTNSAVAALGGGEYQLQRKHTFGGQTFLRDIVKPVSGAVAVYDASNVLLSSTVDYTDGTFTVSSGTPAKWLGQYDLPMTFEADEWSARLDVSTDNLYLVNEPIWMEELL